VEVAGVEGGGEGALLIVGEGADDDDDSHHHHDDDDMRGLSIESIFGIFCDFNQEHNMKSVCFCLDRHSPRLRRLPRLALSLVVAPSSTAHQGAASSLCKRAIFCSLCAI
jgi:hypothetical protein